MFASSTSRAEEGRRNESSFRYEPLPWPKDGSSNYPFRLLQLLPGKLGDPICIRLQHHNIDSLPEYEALSYRWGDSTIKHQVRCNDCLLEVTSSVQDALAQLRYSDQARLLWIDQLCIDQRNLDERSKQVSIMRSIYQESSRTIIWLGPRDAKTAIGLHYVPRLVEINNDLEAAGIAIGGLFENQDLKEEYGLLTRSSQEKVQALLYLLEHPWLERVWIVQEVVVSRAPIVVQVEVEVTWDDFVAALRLICKMQPHASRYFAPVFNIDYFRYFYGKGQFADVKQLTRKFATAKAADPRDKLYALVGISNDASVNIPSMLNYERPLADMFWKWTVYILMGEESLEILSAVNQFKSSRSREAWISWVPDWDGEDAENPYNGTDWPSKLFNAGGSSKAEFEFRDREKVLGVSGYMLDRVEDVGLRGCMPPPNTKILGLSLTADMHYMQRINRSWEAVAKLYTRKTYTSTGESIWDAYWQTCVFGDDGIGEDEKHCVRQEFNEQFDILRKPWMRAEHWKLHWSKHLFAFFSLVYILLQIFGVVGKHEIERGLGQAFSKRCGAGAGRRMIRTESGYIGLAVHAVEVGDRVCLLKGARMPFLVRETPGGLRLVGDCYVHGMMKGERWEEDVCEMLWLL